jgi:hypothetical protein
MRAWLRDLLGQLNDAIDRRLFGMFDVDMGHLDDEPRVVVIDIWDVWLRRLIEDVD